MNRTQFFALGLIGLGIAAAQVQAQTSDDVQTQEKGFYLGGSLGYAQGDVGASDINQRMAELGYDADASVDGQHRTAWNLNAGYRWNRYFETQIGYTDLGEVRTRLTGVTADINDYLTSANQIHPRSGSGYELAFLGRHPLGESYYLYGRAGVFMVESSYRASSNQDSARRSRDEENEFFGVGLGKRINKHWDLRLGVDRYSVENESIPVIGLGALYKFNSHKSRAPERTLASQITPTDNAPEPAQAIPASISLAILFDTDSAQVKEEFMGEVLRLADFMQAHPKVRVTLEGHTDDRGSEAYNQSLSSRRVENVRTAVITRGGIAPERINAVGYGEQKPIADNSTAEGQQANRRVVAVVHQ